MNWTVIAKIDDTIGGYINVCPCWLEAKYGHNDLVAENQH